MPISDYIPEIFGQAPEGYQGLLGAEPTKALQTRANLQGLLGVAASLAQGMSSQGPRRSALQNILGSLAAGYGSTQQAYQQGLQGYGQMQQIAQSKLAAEQAANVRASVEQVMKMPEVANNPALIAALRADPINTLKFINENMAVSRAYAPEAPVPVPSIAPAAPAPVQIQPSTNEYGMTVAPLQTAAIEQRGINEPAPVVERALPEVAVTAAVSPLQKQKDRLLQANIKLTGLPGKTAQDAIKNNLDQIVTIDKQLMQESAASFDFNALKRNVHPDLVNQVTNLQQLAETGQMNTQDLQKGLQDIQKASLEQKNKERDYTNEFIRVAASEFPGKPFNQLQGAELAKVQAKLQAEEIAKRKAGATTVNVGEKSFGTEFGKGIAKSVEDTFSAAQGAQSTLSTIQSIRPIIKAGVYSGPLSTVPRVINQLASSLGVSGANDNETLKNTAVAMQGLASLEMSAAQAMKGQGAITENERGLIKRASAGDLQTFTQGEVLSLLRALEKTSRFKIKAHEKNLQRLRARPDTSELADFYSIEPLATEIPVDSNTSLQEAARQEQERRRGAR